MAIERKLKVFRMGKSRVVKIPHVFDFPGDEVIMWKDGDSIYFKPVKPTEPVLDVTGTKAP